MLDTSLPGAFYMDQAYFKGAVEILRHLEEVDFGRLYCGQVALQDLDKIRFLLRKEVVRLPRFLNTVEKLKKYKVHCRKLIKENEITAAVERVCKPIFVRTAKDFFKEKPKPAFQIAITLPGPGAACQRAASTSRSLDIARLEELARIREPSRERGHSALDGEAEVEASRRVDRARIHSLSVPRRRADVVEGSSADSTHRVFDASRLEEMARPRLLPSEAESSVSERKELDRERLFQLAMPRPRNEGELLGLDLVSQRATSGSRKRLRRSKTRASSHVDSGLDEQSLEVSVDAQANDESETEPSAAISASVLDTDQLSSPPPSAPEVSVGDSVPCERDGPMLVGHTSDAGLPASERRGRRRRSKCRLLRLVQKSRADDLQIGSRVGADPPGGPDPPGRPRETKVLPVLDCGRKWPRFRGRGAECLPPDTWLCEHRTEPRSQSLGAPFAETAEEAEDASDSSKARTEGGHAALPPTGFRRLRKPIGVPLRALSQAGESVWRTAPMKVMQFQL